MVPLNMTYQHCLQHSLFEHLFNLYLKWFKISDLIIHQMAPEKKFYLKSQWTVLQLSITVIYNSAWSILIKRMRV